MNGKKLSVIFAVLMLALSIAGFAYAHWEKIITINGTVNTGVLCWKTTTVQCLDDYVGCKDYHCNDGFAGYYYWQGDKDVGMTTIQIIDDQTVELNLTNVYPSYFTSATLYIVNCGTIPLIFEKVIIASQYETVEIVEDDQIVSIDLNGDGLDDIEIYWGNHIGKQIHPGEPLGEVSFWIHVLQNAPPGSNLSFTVKFVAINWNEYVPP